jgi:hypothetical protein
MQVAPDWSMVGTVEKIEHELVGFKFEGPGIYFIKTDTLLIVPRPTTGSRTVENIWHLKQPEGTVYEVYVYNTPETIFKAIGRAPIRQDDRD